MQDMMLADMLTQQRIQAGDNGPIHINRLPIGLLQMLFQEGRVGGGLVIQGGPDQSLQDIIQHIIENDPNRYGPPPASKKAI